MTSRLLFGTPLSPSILCRHTLLSRCIATPQQSRLSSTQSRSQSTLTVSNESDQASSSTAREKAMPGKRPPPLSIVPTSHLLRTLMITSITTSPRMSNFLTSLLLNYSKFLSSNAITSRLLKITFYDHFCAGNTKEEIGATVQRLKHWGFAGACLNYAREVEKGDAAVEGAAEQELQAWKVGTLKTIEYSASGDYIAIKFSGAGKAVVDALEENKSIPTNLSSAIDEICQLAVSKSVNLLFDAEQAAIQDAIDSYTMRLMKEYNTPGAPPIVYNTYQMYLKKSPIVLADHLALAKKGGFPFGAKVVRGAYLHTDPRKLIHDTKEDTDKCYDAAVTTLLRSPGNIGVVIASHNRESVESARSLLSSSSDVSEKDKKIVAFAQLMGMADEISLDLVAANRGEEKVNVVKYLPWGSLEECIKYLLRRADENKDALQRTVDSRNAVWKEIWRRATWAS